MKVYETNKSLISGAMQSTIQGISAANIAKATYFLRDKIYSDKHKATVTEILCNAVDEHRKYGIKKPVLVFLSFNELVIRDYAKGLSDDDVMRVYFQYFESTKSSDNDGIGGFGIGAKAPSSYADNYSVVSYFGGKKTTFISSINGFNCVASKIHVEDCEENNTGMCVRIPLQQRSDFGIFKMLIKDLYKQIGLYDDEPIVECYIIDEEIDFDNFKQTGINEMYKVKSPDTFNFAESTLRDFRLNHSPSYFDGKLIMVNRISYWDYGQHQGSYFNSSFFDYGTFFAYDGDLCYRLNITREYVDQFFKTDSSFRYILLFKRGELPIMPSREGIEMNKNVELWIEERLKNIAQEFDKMFIDELKKQTQASNRPLFSIFKEHFSTTFFLSILNNSKNPLIKSLNRDVVLHNKNYNGYSYYNSPHDIPVDIFFRVEQNRLRNLTIYKGSSDRVNGRTLNRVAPRVIIIGNNPLSAQVLSKQDIVDTFRLLCIEKYNEDYYFNNYEHFERVYGVVWEKDKKDNMDNVFIHLKNEGILRKDIDYFDLDELIKKSNELKKNPVKKTVNKTISIIDPKTCSEIDEKDYKNTLIFSPSEMSSSSFQFPKDLYNSYLNGSRTFELFSKLTGIKHIVSCYKNSEAKFIKAGCRKFQTFDFTKMTFDIIKKNNIAYITSNMMNYVTLNKIKGSIYNVTYMLSKCNHNYIDGWGTYKFTSNTGYTREDISSLLHTYVNFDTLRYSVLLDKEIDKILEKLSDEDKEILTFLIWHKESIACQFGSLLNGSSFFRDSQVFSKIIRNKYDSLSPKFISIVDNLVKEFDKIDYEELYKKTITDAKLINNK